MASNSFVLNYREKQHFQVTDTNRIMNNRSHPKHSTTNGYAATNGHSSSNGFCNGSVDAVDQIAVPEMCFYCFEVLDAELHNLDVPNEPNFTNDA